MDLMSIRRGLMMAMARGAEVIKGSFTVPNDVNKYTLHFGKTVGSYLFQVEASAESKTAIINSGSTYARTIIWTGYYPQKSIGSYTFPESITANRILPSSGAMSVASPNASICSDSELTFNTVGMLESGWSCVVKGETYDYVIVSLDNV